jgi:hypothetical protein
VQRTRAIAHTADFYRWLQKEIQEVKVLRMKRRSASRTPHLADTFSQKRIFQTFTKGRQKIDTN